MAKVTAPGMDPGLIAQLEKNPWLALNPELVKRRYLIFVSGRGTGKSYKISDALTWLCNKYPGIRVLLTREKADSNQESVKEEVRNHLKRRRMKGKMREANGSFVHINGSKMISKGLNEASGSHKAAKSTAQVDIAWVEEAQEVGAAAWEVFLPTIRRKGSKVIVSANPEDPEGFLAKRWLDDPDEETIVIRLFKEDNPYFPKALVDEMAHDQKMIDQAPSQDARRAAQALYDWKWLGAYKVVTDKQVIKRMEVLDFETPSNAQFYHGMDHGFANDPAAVVRCFIRRDANGMHNLYVDYAAYGHGIEVHNLGKFVTACPTINKYGRGGPQWTVYADCARPELNSMLAGEGLPIEPCQKWEGSVEDGIGFLNSFNRIFVRPELQEFIDECKKYSYKVDRVTGKPLPILEDKFNHLIDAIRYALQDLIKQRATGFFDMPTTEEEASQFTGSVGFY